MKVDVLQVEQAKFRRFRYWSQWVDICTFRYAYDGYILQMRVSRSNKKIFRTNKLGSVIVAADPNTAGDLIPMSAKGEM